MGRDTYVPRPRLTARRRCDGGGEYCEKALHCCDTYVLPCEKALPTQPLRLPHRLPPRLLLSLPLHVSRHRRRLHGAPAGPLPLALPPPHVARPRLPVHVGPALAVQLVYERCPLIQAEPPLRLRRVEERPAYDGRLCTRSPRVLQRQLRMGRVRRVLQPPFRRLRRDFVRRYRRIQARFQLKQPPPSRVRP